METRPGRLMMMPSAALTAILFLATAWWVLPVARSWTPDILKAGLFYSGIYAGAFILVYAAMVVWLRIQAGHLERPDDIQFLGISLPTIYARTGLGWVDLVGLLASAGILVTCLLKPALLFLAPFPLLAGIGFMGGLLVGSSKPWAFERRGSR